MPFTLNHSCYEDHRTRKDIIKWQLVISSDKIDEINKKSYKEYYIDKHKDLKTNFKLKIRCLGRDNCVLEFYYLYPKSLFLKYKLELSYNIDFNRTVADKEYHEIQSNKWEYLVTLALAEIRDYCDSDKYLKIVFTFVTIKNIVPLENIPKRELSNDFQNLLDSGLFSDVIIKSTEGTEFNVHKAILARRCTVLKAHFDHNTLESHTNIVESPLETETLSEVLTFIYSDKCPRVDDIPEKLLAAAEFYQLDKLKHLCEQALQEKLTVDNVIETLELAELYSARMLKNWTLEFITHGHTKEITKTEGWAKIKSIDLIKSIYEYIMDGNDGVEEK